MSNDIENLKEEVRRLNESLKWYQATFENRKLLGIIKDRIVMKLKKISRITSSKIRFVDLLSGGVNSRKKRQASTQSVHQLEVDVARIEEGTPEENNEKSRKERKGFLSDILPHFYTLDDKKWTIRIHAEIDIILPVYNGLDYLKVLIPQIFRNSDLPFNLFIVNDYSPDKRMLPYLKSVEAAHSNVTLINNRKNIGFTHSVNVALRKTKRHVVLLNSDTEVPEGWLSRLVFPIIHNSSIASCTPFSNAATICSFPNIGDNDLVAGLSAQEIDKLFQRGKSYYFEVPTGVGFCMLLNRAAIDKIGLLDEKRFEKGYGEEVDWCQRAIRAGFINVIVQNLFVYHKHGASFLPEVKSRLLSKHQAILNSLYPDFHEKVMNSIEHSFHNKIRELFLVLLGNETAGKRILYYDHDLGGGANLYIENNTEKRKDKDLVLVLKYIHPLSNPTRSYRLQVFYKDYSATFLLDSTNDIRLLFNYIHLDEIIVSEIVSYPDPLTELSRLQSLKKQFGVKISFLLHDYFSVCPNFNLMQNNKKFCNVPEMSGCEKCVSMVGYNPVLFPSDYENLVQWRAQWMAFLEAVDEIICFSTHPRKILDKAYPGLDAGKIHVVPHVVEGIKRKAPAANARRHADGEGRKLNPPKALRIAVLGSIHSEFKGASVVNSLAKLLEKKGIQDITLTVIGDLSRDFHHQRIKITDEYNRENLMQIIESHETDVIFIPSIWPETFSYTTAEAILSGLPVCSFNLGGQADQILGYKKGILFEEMEPENVIRSFVKLRNQQKTRTGVFG